jgi:hypothetical protein
MKNFKQQHKLIQPDPACFLFGNLEIFKLKNSKTHMKTQLICKAAMFVILLQIFSFAAMAQDDSSAVAPQKTSKSKPVKETFECGYLLNNQTIKIPTKHTLEFIVQHRFGKLNSEDFDLLGLYAPSNIRLGLNFSFTDKLQLGVGTTKNNKLQDINWKYALLRQTKSGSMPVSVTYFGNAAIDVRKDIFPKTTNRLSYFHQLMIARKFSNKFSLQIAPSYSHFNMVDSLVKHGNIGLSVIGRYKIADALAMLVEYDQNFTKQESSVLTVKPNLSLGLEASTGSHVFQVFIGTYESIINQHNFLYNANDFTNMDVVIGFNITRLWNY